MTPEKSITITSWYQNITTKKYHNIIMISKVQYETVSWYFNAVGFSMFVTKYMSIVLILIISILGKNSFSRWQFEIFFQKIGFDILCKLSPQETICIKCQSPFSGKKNKKKYHKSVVCWISPEYGKGFNFNLHKLWGLADTWTCDPWICSQISYQLCYGAKQLYTVCHSDNDDLASLSAHQQTIKWSCSNFGWSM